MTEFIPRNIPIYCFFDYHEISKMRAGTTRDVFENKWGFTNFKPQLRITRQSEAMDILWGLGNGLMRETSIHVSRRQLHRFFTTLDMMRIFDKIRSLDTPAIVVYGGTTLKYDIPARYMDNDISFFKLSAENIPHYSSGFMVSPTFAKSAYSYMKKDLFGDDYKLFAFFKDNEKDTFHYHDIISKAMPGCKHNIDELNNMTDEESFGAFV